MTKWIQTHLGNIAVVIMGQSPKSEYYNSAGDGLPFLQGNRTFGHKYPTFDTYTTHLTKIAKPQDIIMSVRAPVGDLNITPVEICIGRGVCALRMKNGNQSFLYYLMKYYVPNLRNKESGTVFGSINRNDIENLDINIPDYDVQKKIAGVLGALDDKIELNNKINQNLEAQAQALFKSWFIDFEPFGGKMPNDWKIGKLGDIADITSGKRPLFKSNIKTSNALIPIVGASGVMGYTKEYLYNNKILVTGRVGTHGIIQRFNKTCWPSDNTLIISSNFYEYVYNYLKIIDFSSMNRGSTQPLITQSDLKKCDIIIPSRLFLDKFEKNVSILFDLKDKNTQEIENLAELRDTLLPKLMNGEIDVDNVKID